MDKYGLLITSPVGPDKNIGDYIQSIAARQYLPSNASLDYIEKEEISKYESDEKVKCIMNAWYIWHPENWPPKEDAINPLLTSIHISPLTAEKMLEDGGKEYFVKHGPVGCRDTGTLEILQNNNIPSYFSGCLTLTLGNTYKNSGKRKGIIFVDPYITPIRYVNDGKKTYYPKNVLKAFLYYLKNPVTISKLAKHKYFKGRIAGQTFYNASIFFHSYSKMFSKEVLLNAEYVSHMFPINKSTTQDVLFNEADRLLKKYSSAQFVVTSRIHCALPCLGMDTPVVFVLDKVMEDDQNVFNAPGRFGGLLDLFRVATYKDNHVSTFDPILSQNKKIEQDFSFKNKDGWKTYRDRLVSQVSKFINGQ